MDEDENPVINGHLFKISSVVHSSKQRSRKFASLEEIPAFLYKLENAYALRSNF